MLKELGEKYGKTPAQVALNWLINSSDVVVVIPGAKSPDQVEQNAGAAGWKLSLEDWVKLDEVSDKVRITRVIW